MQHVSSGIQKSYRHVSSSVGVTGLERHEKMLQTKIIDKSFTKQSFEDKATIKGKAMLQT